MTAWFSWYTAPFAGVANVMTGGVWSFPGGTTVYVCVTGVETLPLTSLEVTVKVCGPSAPVSIGDPFATVPLHVATPLPN